MVVGGHYGTEQRTRGLCALRGASWPGRCGLAARVHPDLSLGLSTWNNRPCHRGVPPAVTSRSPAWRSPFPVHPAWARLRNGLDLCPGRGDALLSGSPGWVSHEGPFLLLLTLSPKIFFSIDSPALCREVNGAPSTVNRISLKLQTPWAWRPCRIDLSTPSPKCYCSDIFRKLNANTCDPFVLKGSVLTLAQEGGEAGGRFAEEAGSDGGAPHDVWFGVVLISFHLFGIA